MKKYFLPILLCPALLCAQSWQWGKRGGSNNTINDTPEQVTAMATDSQGNVYVLSPVGVSGLDVDGQPKQGFSIPGSPIGADQMLASFACDGTLRWAKVFGGPGHDTFTAMSMDGEGNLYVSVFFAFNYIGLPPNQLDSDYTFPQSGSSEQTHKQQIYLFKYDPDGNLQWVRTPQPDLVNLGVSGSGYPLQLETDPAGNSWWWVDLFPGVYGNGAYTVTAHGYHILRYDPDGNFLGGFPLDAQFQASMQVKMRRNHTTGTLYFVGACTPSFGVTATFGGQTVGHDLYVAAFDGQGNYLWTKESSSNSPGASIMDGAIDDNGDIYVTGNARANLTYDGHVFNTVSGSNFPYIMKLNATGDLIWANSATSVTSDSMGWAITPGGITGDYGGMTWDGFTITGSGQAYDVFLARFDPANGQILGLNGLASGVGVVDRGTAVCRDVHGDFVVGGLFGHFLYVDTAAPLVNEGPETDFFVAKFGTGNCDLGLEQPTVPSIRAYPNPVGGLLQLEGAQPGTRYGLYDITGRQVRYGVLSADTSITTAALPPGLYALRLETQNGDIVVKVVKQ